MYHGTAAERWGPAELWLGNISNAVEDLFSFTCWMHLKFLSSHKSEPTDGDSNILGNVCKNLPFHEYSKIQHDWENF
jgi:hypothetical protein